MTKQMTSSDYLPLLEKIRSQIKSWTARTLSFAGRLQLIGSVIFSLTNFWIVAFRLPKTCIKEIDKMCSAFLWSGPTLNPKKAKVAWSEVCTPKSEGGLGLRSLEEANKVCVLKLIWRLLSAKDSLWVDWVNRHLIRGGSFWAVKNNTSSGSWIWRKMLKYRQLAKEFHRVEVHNGIIDMEIPLESKLCEVMNRDRRRNHHRDLLNQIEEELRCQGQHKLADTSCVFCKHPMETREHLFFQCPLSRKIWEKLVRGILLHKFSEKWLEVMKELTNNDHDNTKRFILRFVFQNTIHSIWRERNDRRHGAFSTPEKIVKLIDTNIRHRLSTLRQGKVEKYVRGIQMWFASR
ncbi:putative RNA-directed DNA polymerase [Arabidopsis thaliana]